MEKYATKLNSARYSIYLIGMKMCLEWWTGFWETGDPVHKAMEYVNSPVFQSDLLRRTVVSMKWGGGRQPGTWL